MFRALDLRQTGATYREIATALGRDDALRLSASDWKMSASRSFVVRLVRDGIAMINGDYRKLLRIRYARRRALSTADGRAVGADRVLSSRTGWRARAERGG